MSETEDAVGPGYVLLSAPWLAILNGWALMLVWNWTVPLLGGPTIGFALALMLNILGGFVRTSNGLKTTPTRLKVAFLKPVLIIGVAAAIRAIGGLA